MCWRQLELDVCLHSLSVGEDEDEDAEDRATEDEAGEDNHHHLRPALLPPQPHSGHWLHLTNVVQAEQVHEVARPVVDPPVCRESESESGSCVVHGQYSVVVAVTKF